MLQFRTQGFNGSAVKYSPFFDNRLAVASAANFGLVGNGRLWILELTPEGIVPMKWFATQDALYDLAWSEIHENQVLTASGDGSIKLFDCGVNEFPIQQWKEHGREVFSVNWNMIAKDKFCSSSWDGTVRIWSPHREQSLLTLPIHSCTYSATFTPHSPDLLSAVSSDGQIRLFDLRTPASASNHLVMQFRNHGSPGLPGQYMPPAAAYPNEVLTHDWNKYRPSILATGGVDTAIRTFDIRSPNPGLAITTLTGHSYAVKKLSWSPHLSSVLLSASYDMTCRVWSDGSDQPAGQLPSAGSQLGMMNKHTEFATGIDWCLFGNEGWCASVGWDENLFVWDVRGVMT
ncbi:peroxisomal targeting signal 2 receptor [Penicillium odoratum]|uniref:peroxisomal targeting signal 2 receptor n=1 Tax=Penicillium odoratum TaxID=1167516 RepID=UPI0025493868|nr:peroxisomal targeting signal 2 receptor [Penicillium odoratum]KAJ5764938.1 peroxisomal targeting signal 2 receptor [Penicillium odoratum]